MGLKHAFKSEKPDPADSTIIGATKWNDDHYFLDASETPIGAVGDLAYRGTDGLVTLLTGAQGVLTSAGAGNVPAWSMAPGLTSLTASAFVAVGSPVASSGSVRLANTGSVVGRNAANTADVMMIQIKSDGDVTIRGIWNVDSSGHLKANADNTYDIGATGATRPRSVFVGTNVTVSNQVRSAQYNGVSDGIAHFTNNAANGFTRLILGTNDTSGVSIVKSTTTGIFSLGDGSARAALGSLYDYFGSGSPEGAVSAPVGSTFHRTNGGAGTSFYVKESGAGNTGWVAK